MVQSARNVSLSLPAPQEVLALMAQITQAAGRAVQSLLTELTRRLTSYVSVASSQDLRAWYVSRALF